MQMILCFYSGASYTARTESIEVNRGALLCEIFAGFSTCRHTTYTSTYIHLHSGLEFHAYLLPGRRYVQMTV